MTTDAQHEAREAAPSAGTVRLVGYPIRLGQLQQQHTDELLRELSLLIISRDSGGANLHAPQRLLNLVDMLVGVYSSEIEDVERQRRDAAARGEAQADIVYPSVPGLGKIIDDYELIADEVDEFCRNGNLLTLATPPHLLQLRHWTLREFRHQLAGGQPTRWDGPLD